MVIAIKAMILGEAAGLFEVCEAMIPSSGEIGISVIMKLYQSTLDGKIMPIKWQTSALVPIFNKK